MLWGGMWGTVLQGRWAYFCVCEMQGHQKIGIHTSHTSLPAQLSASSPPHWNIPHPCSLMQSSYLHCTQLCATAGSKCRVTWWNFASFLGSVFHSTRLLPSFTRKRDDVKPCAPWGGWSQPISVQNEAIAIFLHELCANLFSLCWVFFPWSTLLWLLNKY